MSYIEREALKKKLGDLHFPNYGYALIAINEMPVADVEPVDRWISVEDRLPDTEVLCANFKKETYGYGEMIIGYIDYNEGYERYDAESKSEVLENVTHWQPLPEPPKGAEE